MGRDKREQDSKTFRKPRAETQVGNVADWGGVNEKVLVKAIETASKKGGALRLGYTRDGGAYAIGVYAGSNYFTDYVRPSEDIDSYLTALTASFEEYTGEAETVPTPTGSKRR
jgi:hypothetical protein